MERKIELDKWYSLTDLAAFKLLPVNNNRENLAKLVDIDMKGANLLDAEKTEWKIKGKYTYRILGSNYLRYISFKGYNQ